MTSPANLFLLLVGAAAVYFIMRAVLSSRPGLSLQTAQEALRAGTAVLVDVREPPEWQSGVAQPAVLLPLSDLRGGRSLWQPFLEKNKTRRLLLYCHSGARSGMASSLLRREGFQAANLGGFSVWSDAGLPVRRPS